MDKWTELRTAYHVAKFGTVSEAASALGIHRATVNRHIDLLEEALGARVFIRNSRGYLLTDVGQEVLEVAEKAQGLIKDLSGRIHRGQNEIGKEISITVPAPITKVVWEPIQQFRRDHPNYRVDVIASQEQLKLEYGEAHIAIRLGDEPEHPDYVVKPLGSMGMNLYAHQSYIERKGRPKDEHDFAGHEFITSSNIGARWSFRDWLEQYIEPAQIVVTSNDTTVLIQAMRRGLGMGVMDEFEAANEQELEALLPQNPEWAIDMWLVTHVDLHRTEKVQALWKQLMASVPDLVARPKT
ncbi:MAG: LysR family transcriptional regulator [Pseudomonadota bacterium]